MPQSMAADLTILPTNGISDHALTSHIASRFHQGLPFVTVSTGMLLMLNTFAPFDINQSEELKMLAVRVHNRLCLRGESQNVLFLGESGSGKSEFRGSVLGHFLGKYLLQLLSF